MRRRSPQGLPDARALPRVLAAHVDPDALIARMQRNRRDQSAIAARDARGSGVYAAHRAGA